MTINQNFDMTDKHEYGFYGRLSAAFPSQIIIDSTEYCNLECVHCPHPSFKKSEHYAGRYLEMSLLEKLVLEVAEYGRDHTKYIRFTSNGEPLIHKKWAEMLKFAVDYSGTTVTLTTNGVLLDDKRIAELLNTGVNLVDISIDAYKNETYQQIRRKGNLEVTKRNVNALIGASKARGGDTKVVVSYIEQPQNIEETTDFEKYWRDQGADYVVIRRLHSCCGAKEELAQIRRDKFKTKARRPCLYPWERMTLNAKGWLAFCPADWVHGSEIAPYSSTTVKETWEGEFYRKLRSAHLTNEYSKHRFCGQCPDWESTRWPDEGRSYADMVEEFTEQ